MRIQELIAGVLVLGLVSPVLAQVRNPRELPYRPTGGGSPTSGPVGGGSAGTQPPAGGLQPGAGGGSLSPSSLGGGEPSLGPSQPGTPVPGPPTPSGTRPGIPPGGVGPGLPGPPIGPSPPPVAPRGGVLPLRAGRTRTPVGLPYAADRWENWWTLNRDRYLDVNRTFASRARIREIPADVFLGAVIDPALADPVFLNRGPVSDLLVPKLRWHLTHGSAVVRGEAALALGKIGGAEEVPLLVAMTRDRNRFVRQLALLGLGLTRTEAALQVLASFAVSSAEQTADRAYAVLGLGLVGSDDALLPLSTLLHRGAGDRNLAAATLYALGFVPDSNAGELLRQFVRERGNRGDERAVATLALGKLGSSGDVPLLLRLLGDPEVHVRRSAALALGQVGYRSELPTRRDALLIKLERWNEGRVISAEARRRLEDHLAHLGRRAARETRDLKNLERRVIATLAVALDRDRDSMVRQFSAIALGRIGSPQARVHLAKTFKKTGGVSAARGFVALALGISDAREASDLLRGNLGRKGLDASSRSAVVLALGLMEDMNAGPDLVALALGRGSPELRAAAAISCGMMNHRKAKTAFRVQLRDRTHAFLRPMFGLALGLLGDREALDTLEELVIEGSSSMARIQAVQALASIRDFASVKVLCELLKRPDITDAVRATALHAVGQIAEKGVLPGLEPLARDWNYLLPFSVINDAVLR